MRKKRKYDQMKRNRMNEKGMEKKKKFQED